MPSRAFTPIGSMLGARRGHGGTLLSNAEIEDPTRLVQRGGQLELGSLRPQRLSAARQERRRREPSN
jgi:hypothetical protein